MDHLDWRKSSRSSAGSDAACVEIARLPQTTSVRDSKNPATGILTFPTAPWASFLSTLV
ncbi:hypothetical protein JOF56_011447 [Kibdelosporangium banguiense]|uniref:DUF397 domain-containing protein n=1 Tax=Kibdelosporangium banguiense TaxID=1365924 RepID=A0ABS4U318_9PSEU|nr:DUF397 domain-containing protein [Kibdelosporangium banguiense]MBP2331062.1 hypothetical protein [Kibdelosporangium banguiense]